MWKHAALNTLFLEFFDEIGGRELYLELTWSRWNDSALYLCQSQRNTLCSEYEVQ